MLLAIVCLVVASSIVAIMLITPQYEATARLRIEPSQNALIGQPTTGSSLPDQSIVETEASVMRSHDLAIQVVRKLNLAEDREFTKTLDPLSANASAGAKKQYLDDVADIVASRVSAQREKATYVVDLSFQSPDAAKAAKLANAFAEIYIESSVSRRTGTAARQAAMLEKRLAQLGQSAQSAEARLGQYRAATGIVGEGSVSVTDQQISPLASQVATAESEAAAARSKLAAARSQIGSGGITAVSAVLGSTVISNLRAQRAALVTQSSEIVTRYGPRHPESIRIKEQLQAIDQQIQEEANRVIGSLQSEAGAATARAASLRSDLNQLKGAQAAETQYSATADTYKRAAESSRTAYNQASELVQKTNQIAASPMAQAQIIESASIPAEPSAPNKKMLLAASFAFALLLGTGTVAIQELLSAGLRTRKDLESIGLPLIASIPLASKAVATRRSPADALVDAPFTAYAEAFRSIRSTLTISSEKPLKVIALVSSMPGEGKTTTSLSLARMMAMSGERTVVVDLDTRRAGLSAVVNMGGSSGLVEVLRDGIPFTSAIQPDVVEKLDILPVSAPSFVPDDLFTSDPMRDLLTALRSSYDCIIFDTPPLLGVADARAVAAIADAVIVAVRWDKTPKSAVVAVRDILEQDHAKTVGAIYTMVDPNAEVNGALYYSNRYSAYYQKD
jgi:succinoglycan biosynthesis transport protein ExoP